MNRLPISMEQDRKYGRLFLGACAMFTLGGLTYAALDNANHNPDPNAVPLENIAEVDRNGDGKSDTDIRGRGSKADLHYILQYDETGTPVVIPPSYVREIDPTRPYKEQRGF
ncbi:MAG: hypothetical protein WC852_05185 [Candidatus Nanoarchaeia archaeon]